MRVGIFVVFAGRGPGGPQTYELAIGAEVARADPNLEVHLYCLEPGAREAFGDLPANARLHVLKPSSRWVSVPISLPLSLLRDRIDLLHCTVVPPPLSPVRSVFTMHDVSPFAHPEFYPDALRRRLCALIQRGLASAKAIICVSSHARDSTVERFGIDPARISVVHHGIDPAFHPVPLSDAQETLERSLGLQGSYILFTGHLERRKNLVRLLEAYARLSRNGLAARLVLAGNRNFDTAFLDEALDRLSLRGRVVELGHIPQECMPALYSAADMLAFPTLWEGFGFPVLEAMACGIPVLTSNRSSLPEIAGRAALLVDPESVDQIAAGMERLMEDTKLRSVLRERGLKRAAEFTWQRAARETLDVYKKAVT